MTAAPERIWTDFTAANRVDLAYDNPPTSLYSECQEEYIAVTALSSAPEVLELIRQAVEAERERMREVYHGPLWRLILGSEECLQAVCADTSGENCHCGKKIKRIERFAMLGAGE